MAGIVAIGAALPRYRLDRKAVFTAMGWFNPALAGVARGERTVANHDEDSLTLAVAAARDALTGRSSGEVDALYLASTSLPYAERQNAAIAAAACDLPTRSRTQDLTGSLRGGTGALLSGLEAVRAGGCRQPLVVAADCRLGKMGSRQELLYGDGGAALLLGATPEEVAAEFVAGVSRHADFADTRRTAAERFGHAWEERWIREEGHLRLLGQVAQDCLQQAGVAPTELTRVAITGPDARTAASLLKKWGLPPEKLQDNLAAGVGDTGTAHPLLLLAAALEQAGPGQLVLLLAFGSGADALLFRTTDRIDRIRPGRGVAGNLSRRAVLSSYEKYAVFRRLLPLEVGIRGETVAPTAFSVLWRDRAAVLSLHGSRCTCCATPQFPPRRICVNPGCGAADRQEPYPFAGRRGQLFTYTADSLAFSYDPPACYGLIDCEGGGRLFLDLTDCQPAELAVGQTVEMTFRRKYLDEPGGVHGYFWKARPVDMRSAT